MIRKYKFILLYISGIILFLLVRVLFNQGIINDSIALIATIVILVIGNIIFFKRKK